MENSINKSNEILDVSMLYNNMADISKKYLTMKKGEVSAYTLGESALDLIHVAQKNKMKEILKKTSLSQKVHTLKAVHDDMPVDVFYKKTKPYIEKHILYSIIENLEEKLICEFGSMEKGHTKDMFDDLLESNNIALDEMLILIELMEKKEDSYLRSHGENHKVSYEWIIKDLKNYIHDHQQDSNIHNLGSNDLFSALS